jgi:hypothetical protein
MGLKSKHFLLDDKLLSYMALRAKCHFYAWRHVATAGRQTAVFHLRKEVWAICSDLSRQLG